MRRSLRLALVAGCALLTACGRSPAPPPADQVQADLVGQTFAFFEDGEGKRTWTILEGEVRDLLVLDVVEGAEGRMRRVLAEVTLASPHRTIWGELVIDYEREGDAWALREVRRARGANWQARDRNAILYAATPGRAFGRGAEDPRMLHLEPVVILRDSVLVDPFEPFAADFEALDRARGDTLAYPRARRALQQSLGERYFGRGRTLYLTRQGRRPDSLALGSPIPEVGACRRVVADARAASAEAVEAGAFATTSSVMAYAVPATPMDERLERVLLRLAREAFREEGVPEDLLDRIRTAGILAMDLDGDLRAELAGAFQIVPSGTEGQPAQSHRLFLLATPQSAGGPYALSIRRYLGPDAGRAERYTLLGSIDLDMDGALEVVARLDGAAGHTFVLFGRRDGRWREIYRGGGRRC